MKILGYLLGGFMLLDGLLLAFFGRRYLHAVNFDFAPKSYHRFIHWQIQRPRWLIRSVGAAESLLGLLMIQKRREA